MRFLIIAFTLLTADGYASSVHYCGYLPPGAFSDEPPHVYKFDTNKEVILAWRKSFDQLEAVLMHYNVTYSRSDNNGICYPKSVSEDKKEYYSKRSKDIEWLKAKRIYIDK